MIFKVVLIAAAVLFAVVSTWGARLGYALLSFVVRLVGGARGEDIKVSIESNIHSLEFDGRAIRAFVEGFSAIPLVLKFGIRREERSLDSAAPGPVRSLGSDLLELWFASLTIIGVPAAAGGVVGFVVGATMPRQSDIASMAVDMFGPNLAAKIATQVFQGFAMGIVYAWQVAMFVSWTLMILTAMAACFGVFFGGVAMWRRR